jgi:glycosidase
MATQHPEWYQHDWKGNFRPTPWFDWTDIINLDYSQPGLRRYMTEAMKFWVKEAGIDGYRCDVASFVPVDFWNNVRRELDEIKPVFMLAEADLRDLHENAFDATYAWSWYEAMHQIAKGKADVGALFGYYSANEGSYPPDCMRMTFVSNHDKNAWEGTPTEQFGDALEATIVLSVVGEGIPMLHNGQEAGESKRLKFFEKDPIEWKTSPMAEFYRRLFALKKENTALWNGHWGARMIPVVNTAPGAVLSFVRQNERDKVFAVFNFSAHEQKVHFTDGPFAGGYKEFFSGDQAGLSAESELTLPPWSYRVYLKAAAR